MSTCPSLCLSTYNLSLSLYFQSIYLYFFISLSLFLVNIGISLYFYVYISLYPSLSFFSLFPQSLMSIFVSLHAILSLSLSLSLPHTHSQSHSFASQLHTLFRSLTFLTLSLCVYNYLHLFLLLV